jgi:hypothetical protein
MSRVEKNHYIALAASNSKNHLHRAPGEEIQWEKFYRELYPELEEMA